MPKMISAQAIVEMAEKQGVKLACGGTSRPKGYRLFNGYACARRVLTNSINPNVGMGDNGIDDLIKKNYNVNTRLLEYGFENWTLFTTYENRRTKSYQLGQELRKLALL